VTLQDLVSARDRAALAAALRAGGHTRPALAYALCGAICHGDEAMVRDLLAAGADPSFEGIPGEGMGPIHCAIEMEELHLLRVLLEADGDVNLVDNGLTTLCNAIEGEHDAGLQQGNIRVPPAPITRALLTLGAAPGRAAGRESELEYARQRRHLDAMAALTEPVPAWREGERVLRLMPWVGPCSPLWDVHDPRNVDPASLPISAALITELSAWDKRYGGPRHGGWSLHASPSGFRDDAEEAAYWEEAERLGDRLRQELGPSWTILVWRPPTEVLGVRPF
jgi:hypothetical protein